jgi:hypothetical protein
MEPWQKQAAKQSSGTGMYIGNNRILTNAHVVDFVTQIYVIPDDSDQQWKAKLVHYAPMMDLAIIELDDPTKLEGRQPIEFDATRIPVEADVTVYGFPVGGERLSITKGIVSRYDYKFLPPHECGLRMQIDAAINPGNSGGPAFHNGKVIGLANSRLRESDNIGFVIPVEEIQFFLKDVEDGKFDGQLFLWDIASTVENDAQRKFLKMPEGQGGRKIETVHSSVPDYPLQAGDIVTHIGPYSLDLNCNIRVDEHVLVGGHYAFPRVVVDGKVPVSVMRGDQKMDLMVPATPQSALLFQPFDNRYPDYAIFGPLPFTVVSMELSSVATGSTEIVGSMLRQSNPIALSMGRDRVSPDEQMVVTAGVPWSHPLMKGYGRPFMDVLEKINGTPVKNLKHLVELMRDCKDEYIEMDFAGITAESYIFNRQELLDSTEEVLSDNNIRDQFSPAMREVWETQ